ncbi:DUF2534 family protein [Leptospira interrogans]
MDGFQGFMIFVYSVIFRCLYGIPLGGEYREILIVKRRP